jgi:hypothetical protein
VNTFSSRGYYASANDYTWSMNFGNGYLGTTSHGETNADDAGIGLFKYDVPAGYYALCTTNLGDNHNGSLYFFSTFRFF